MPGHMDPEALSHDKKASKYTTKGRLTPSLAGTPAYVVRQLSFYRPRSIRRLLIAVIGLGFVISTFVVSAGLSARARRTRQWVMDLVAPHQTWLDNDLNTPPRYRLLMEEQKRLPQHNLSLPFPEGATGRYVKFTSQINMLGWNNVFNELLMLNHLAYRSKRAYVYQDYVWKMEYYPWSRNKAWHYHARTPLRALISGPTAGGPWPAGDPAPRSVHRNHWDVVCPKHKRKIIWTHHIKKQYGLHWWPSGKEIFDTWNKVLLDEEAQCVEVIAPPRDVEDFGQVFDLWLWGSERILNMWEEIRDSPVSQLLGTSPLIQRAVDRNEHLFRNEKTINSDPFDHVFSIHIRRGDFIDACINLANYKSLFYSWNNLPWLPDRFTPPPGGEEGKNTPENTKIYLDRCLPDMDAIIKRITDARDDWEKEVFGERRKEHFITTLYILTNDKSKWLVDLKERLKSQDQWKIVTSHDIVFGDAQEKDVGMATDMELARKSAIFMGNGWSSFTSNILHRRLVDKKIAISNRFF